MTRENFYHELEANGITLSDLQKSQLHQFFEWLVDWNERMNLTGITEENEVYAKHFYDSIQPFIHLPMQNIRTICDVGTGAGFPGIPMSIIWPHVEFDLIDSLGKRIDFLNAFIDEVGLTNVRAIHVRAEDFATDKRASFDIVTSRAVARLNMLLELCAPLAKVDGQVIALKGPAGSEELLEAKHAPQLLGLALKEKKEVNLEGIGERVNLYFEKVKKTPVKYPRNFGQIKKKPLV